MRGKHWFIFPLLLGLALSAQDRGVVLRVGGGSRRLALVIGNNAYRDHPLRNAVNDAQTVGAVLAEVGFEVDLKLNVGIAQMEEAAGEFAARVRPGDVAIFYYSGHGMQVGDQNYLIPVDFEARTAVDAKYKSYAASRIQENLEAAGVGLQIIILDACRDNPYRSLRSGAGGLAAMQAGRGTYIAFATGPGKTADDNPRGRNGLFTGALVEALREPGLTLDQVFNRVRGQVAVARPEQVPWSSSNVLGDFYFRPGTTATPVIAPTVAAPRPADLDAWEAVRETKSAELLQSFLNEFPASQYAPAARIELAALRSEVSVPNPPTAVPSSLPSAGPRPGDVKVNPQDGLDYVWIPPGTFTMGCSSGDTECGHDEKPAHEVTITKGFWMGQTEVTQEAYQRVTGNNPSHFKGAKFPVETVSWNEAQSYCRAVGMRLPTEAEWEYAVRGGSTGSRYGDIDQIAWYARNSGNKMHEVGQKQPNAWGLHDMLGNVWEWVADWYSDYPVLSQRDPVGPASGQTRVLRGGSWNLYPGLARASYRNWSDPQNRSDSSGLRCAGN